MSCLNISLGLFVNVGPTWLGAGRNGSTENGADVTNAADGCTIAKGGGSVFISPPPSGSVFFMVFGNPLNFVAVMTKGFGSNPDHAVFIVDVTGTTPVLSLEALASSALEPRLQPSSGDGSVCLLIGGDNSGGRRASFRRSDNGVDLGTIRDPFTVGDGHTVIGNASETHLQVLESGVRVVEEFERPTGVCAVEPSTLSFEDAVIDQGVTLISQTVRATISNVGKDCLRIEEVANEGPYTVTGDAPGSPLPFPITLDQFGGVNDEVSFNVIFAPTTAADFNLGLPITFGLPNNNSRPATGPAIMPCIGTGREVESLGFPTNIDFRRIPINSASPPHTLTIENRDDAVTVNLDIPDQLTGIYTWNGFVGPLQPRATQNIDITFTPNAERPLSGELEFDSDLSSSPHRVTLNGEGCVPRVEIDFWPHAPQTTFNFGSVEHGFRTVRMLKVLNTGNSTLTFRARTEGNSLFGLQTEGGSITSPAAELSFTVEPVSRCGAGEPGSGEVLFAVTFFADDTVEDQQGQLVIFNHNVQSQPAELRFLLNAHIEPTVNVDVELVLDRSGSMGQDSGSRRKIVTALSAARLFVQMGRTDVGDRLGLVKFNTVPETVLGLTPLDGASQQDFFNALRGDEVEDDFAPLGRTAIAGGVLQATRDLAANPRPEPPPEFKRVMVVLTDGNENTPYLNPDDDLSYTLLGENDTIPVPLPPGVSVYGIGIGENVNTGRLAQLCPTTGGRFLSVSDFSGMDFFKLEEHFTRIYMAVNDISSVLDPAFLIRPNERHEHPFQVLRGDVNIMVVVYDRDFVRLPFYLMTPRGEMVDPGSVPPGFQIRPGLTDTARFIEVRMPQGEPERYAGTWKAVVAHDGKLCSAPGVPTPAFWTKAPIDVIARVGKDGKKGEEVKLSPGFTTGKCADGSDATVMYGIAIGTGSNFRMMPFVDPGLRRVGEPIQLNALMSEFGLPVKRCEVTVTATAPNGATHTLTLRDDGAHQDNERDDGDYGGVYPYANQEGMYDFLFRARGRSRDGEPVTREMTLSKYVEGREKLFGPGGGQKGDKCCRRLEHWLRVLVCLGAGLLFLFLLFLLLWRLG
jgi:Mg-chelatase subunit ChlD